MDGRIEDAEDNVLRGLENAPSIFVEGYRGALARSGMIKLNFFSNRFDPASNTLAKDAAVTLVMPLDDFAAVAEAFHVLVQDLRAQGAIPPAPEAAR